MGATSQKRGSLHSTMGRPKKGALSSYPQRVRDLIRQIREAEPFYGPQTIRSELRNQYGYRSDALPSHSRVASFLKEEGFTASYEKHVPLPEQSVKVEAPHDVWQIDGRGNEAVENIGAIALLDIKDVFSCVYISCFPALMKSMKGHPNTDNYQMTLRLGFLEFGLPKMVQADHASVFYDNNSKSPFPTRLHLWLVGLGIDLFHSRVHRPTDQAKVERSHEILYKQTLTAKAPFRDWEHLFEKCQKRKKALNYQIESSSTNMQAPLDLYPDARHSQRPYSLQNEAKLMGFNRIYQYLSKGKWYRKVATNKMVFLGGQSYYIKNAKPKEQLEITFCPNCQFLLFQNDKEHLVAIQPIKGINAKYLMGSVDDFFSLPNLQLKIPFDFEEKSDTTLRDFALARLNNT